ANLLQTHCAFVFCLATEPNAVAPPHPTPYTLHPSKVLWVGIGCQRGTSRELIEMAIEHVFKENQLVESAIAGIATIDTKSNEVGLLELCQDRNLPLKTFACDILSQVCIPNPSQAVQNEVGTLSVAEAAALCASESQTLLIPKQIFKSSSVPISTPLLKGAVTVAVAQAKQRLVI
ncbi:MAG: cobalamin biosynthesis protein, partial [Scytonema sp. PMC 1069.18]|nr:cobalamin biosynthesis protein [Scytonema sp. PMC 1069.18]